MNEIEAVTARHPRFVSRLGDSRERRVPCSCCGRPTLALSPLLCGRCLPISADGPSPAVADAATAPPVVGVPGPVPSSVGAIRSQDPTKENQ